MPAVPGAESPRQQSSAPVEGPGPLALPVGGVIVDPLGPGVEENPPSVDQPDASVNPYFPTTNLALGLFGSGFGRGDDFTRRVSVAVGGGQVWVAAGGSPGRLVYSFDTVDLSPGQDEEGTANDIPASWATGLSTLHDIAYYRGNLYVLGTQGSTSVVKVFTPQGVALSTLRPDIPSADSEFTGLDVAWNELWLSRPANKTANAEDLLGQEIAVFDARTGALKGISRNPLSERRDVSPRGWWDLAIVPELGGAVVDRRMFARGTVLPGLATSDSEGCTAVLVYACASADQRGVDAPWGMRWFLELVSGAANGTYRPVKEFAIVKRSLAPQTALLDPVTEALGPLGTSGYYLTQKREWVPYVEQVQGDPHSLSDVAYNNRELRIDWYGDLAKAHWQRGDRQCVHYIVSDADVFVVGAKGERRYELARGFEQIGYRIAKPGGGYGPLQDVRTGIANAAGDFCIDTTALDASGQLKTPDGVNKILLEAEVGSRTITVENTQLRIDNENPSGGLDAPTQFLRAQVAVSGTIADPWSGPQTATIDVLGPRGQWQMVCSAAPLIDPVVGRYSCDWNTAATEPGGGATYPDGAYQIRATLRDTATGTLHRGGETAAENNRMSVTRTATVDNTPPVVDNMQPDLYEDSHTAVGEIDTTVGWTHADVVSGVRETSVEVNAASDGTSSGSWQPIGTSSDQGEVTVPWNTASVDGGLYRFRARSCDNAGNCSQREWQALAPPVAARSSGSEPSPFCATSGFVRCYAGKPANAYPHRSYGTEATLTTPGTIRYQTAEQASAAWTGVGGLAFTPKDRLVYSGSLQTGITTQSYCGANPITTQTGEKRDRWFRYVEYIFPNETQYLTCFGSTGVGTTNSYKVDILSADGYRAKAYINGALKLVDLHNEPASVDARYKRRGYYLTRYGNRNTAALGEVTTRARQMGGKFSAWAIQRTARGAWAAPSTAKVSQDPGYVVRSASLTTFCVADKARGCSP
jgi:hypothetical protein